MDDLPQEYDQRRGVSKHLWHGESACPHAAGTGGRRDPLMAFTRATAIGIGFSQQGDARYETSSSPEFPQARRRTHRDARVATTGVRARLSDAADENRRRF